MTAKETFSPGDAMRDIYTRGLVTGDFVLVMGDLVSNIRIDEVVKVHKERRKVNKDAIMTMVVKESGARHRTRDFVHGVLTSDLLMKNIYCYVAKDGYAARVKDTKSYDSISKDILSRWTFPLVPDNNHPAGHVYEHRRGNKYIAKDNSVILARQQLPSWIFHQVFENAQIISSVIGRDCVIGPGTIVDNSYIFDGTKIGAGCIIEKSIIGAGVIVRDDTRIEKGCLVGDGVMLNPALHLGPFERLSRRRDERGDDDDESDEEASDTEELEEDQEAARAKLGVDEYTLVWTQRPPEEDDDDDGVENAKNQRFMRIGDNASDIDESDPGSESEDSESEDSDDDSDIHLGNLPTSSTTSLDTTIPVLPSSDSQAESEFRHEVELSLERAFSEGHSVDNAAVELKTLRMASNVPIARVRDAVVAAIVEKINIIEGGGLPQRKEIAAVIGRWGPLIEKIGGFDAVETITALQIHCTTSDRLGLFGQILAALYQDDVVEEDDIRAWHKLSNKGVPDGSVKGEYEQVLGNWGEDDRTIRRARERRTRTTRRGRQ
ncbi:translation initiation factor eIF-2B epsilon subunit, GEF [Paramarasmius palmivorus]|uniref:Translation initiation factor eIF-2B epsilon subunit, GEF n=1 Tax=Paramarasmius palmivorus TaxID=297713 RepID=A0AAW0DQG0_9AGAR